MKKRLYALLLCAMTGAICGCGVTEQTAEQQTEAYHKIAAEEAKQMMDDGGVTVVDVRTAEEYAEGHIANAVLLPNETITDEQPDALPELQAVLLVYCRSGRRSKEAADKLVAMGYQSVYDFGGILDWPYAVVTD